MLQGPSGRSNKGGEGVQEGSVAPAGRKTLETLGAADSIAEALEMAANERKRHEVSLIFHSSKIIFSGFNNVQAVLRNCCPHLFLPSWGSISSNPMLFLKRAHDLVIRCRIM